MSIKLLLGATSRGSIRGQTLAEFRERTGIAVEVIEPFQREADEPPCDLLLLEEWQVVDRIRAGTLAQLGRRAHRDGIDLDDFPQAAIDRFRASDVVYAIPYRASSQVLIYRADLLERYGVTVPETLDDLRVTTIAIHEALRSGGDDDIAGIVLPGAAGYAEVYGLLGDTIFPSWGWRPYRGTGGPPLVYQAATVDALAFLVSLVQSAGSGAYASATVADARRRFADGRAVFLVDCVTAFATLRQLMAGSDARPAIAMIPSGPTGRPEPGLTAPSLCIAASSANPDGAWELLRMLISGEELLRDAVDGFAPETPRESVFASDGYAAIFDEATRAVLERTRTYARINRPLIPYGVALGEIAGAAAQTAIAGEQSADDVLRIAQATIDGMDWSGERPWNLGSAG